MDIHRGKKQTKLAPRKPWCNKNSEKHKLTPDFTIYYLCDLKKESSLNPGLFICKINITSHPLASRSCQEGQVGSHMRAFCKTPLKTTLS